MRTKEEVDDKIAMFYKAKRESTLTEEQHRNCDEIIRVLRWFLGDSPLGVDDKL